jgi:hypothetical protein
VRGHLPMTVAMEKLAVLVLVCAVVACGEVDSREDALESPNDDSGEMSPNVDTADAGVQPAQAPQGDAMPAMLASPADAAVPSQDDAATVEPAADAGEPAADAAPAPRVERTDVTLAVLRAEVIDDTCLSCHDSRQKENVRPWFNIGPLGDYFPAPGVPGEISPCGIDYVFPGHLELSMIWLTFSPELPEKCNPHPALVREPSQAQLDAIADYVMHQARW